MKDIRKELNQQQTKLRSLLKNPNLFNEAIQLFLRHHATLHAANMSNLATWSYEDAIFENTSPELIRHIPKNQKHSIAWIIFHIARIEDVTMNLLVAGEPQLYISENWQFHLGITDQTTGNEMDEDNIAGLSEAIDLEALRAYRAAVGQKTERIVNGLRPEELKLQVDPDRVRQVMAQGALGESSKGIAESWSRRDTAGLLLMPVSRHLIVHLNEAWRLKSRLQ